MIFYSIRANLDTQLRRLVRRVGAFGYLMIKTILQKERKRLQLKAFRSTSQLVFRYEKPIIHKSSREHTVLTDYMNMVYLLTDYNCRIIS
jgi:hypothetical protein